MQSALDSIDQDIEVLAAAHIALLTTDQLGPAVLQIQTQIERLKVVQARVLLEADRARIWVPTGHRNIEQWLAANGKTTITAAVKQKQLGEALNTSKPLADAVDRGELSTDTAVAILPALGSGHSGDETSLVDACKGATPTQARDAGTKFIELNPPDGQTDAQREHAKRQRRALRFSDNGDGMTRIDGLLPVLDGEIVQRALKSIIGTPDTTDDRTSEQRNADALVMLADAYAKGEVRGGRERPTVVVVIDIDTLQGHTPGTGTTTSGKIVPAEIVRRMVGNANLVRVLSSDSVPLDMGRAARLATNDQFNAIVARDGAHCGFDNCQIPADWCEIDHIREWEADHGLTDLRFLWLNCWYHHHFRHRPDVTLNGDNVHNLSITLPDGTTIQLLTHLRPDTQTDAA